MGVQNMWGGLLQWMKILQHKTSVIGKSVGAV